MFLPLIPLLRQSVNLLGPFSSIYLALSSTPIQLGLKATIFVCGQGHWWSCLGHREEELEELQPRSVDQLLGQCYPVVFLRSVATALHKLFLCIFDGLKRPKKQSKKTPKAWPFPLLFNHTIFFFVIIASLVFLL